MVKKYGGYTLLELLIVIGLIGILLAIATTSYGTIQKKSRDSRRMSDMKSIQNAAEQYYADNSNMYPTSAGALTLAGTYLPGGIPSDPKNVTPYLYASSFEGDGSGYCLCATLESGGGNATANDCSAFAQAADSLYYCVKNIQ